MFINMSVANRGRGQYCRSPCRYQSSNIYSIAGYRLMFSIFIFRSEWCQLTFTAVNNSINNTVNDYRCKDINDTALLSLVLPDVLCCQVSKSNTHPKSPEYYLLYSVTLFLFLLTNISSKLTRNISTNILDTIYRHIWRECYPMFREKWALLYLLCMC